MSVLTMRFPNAGAWAKGVRLRKAPHRRTFQGLPIHIEHDVGDTRSGTAPDGTKWATKMRNAYGEILGTLGADGDPLDVFLGPDRHAAHAYVVQAKLPGSQAFDECKLMLGFPTRKAAVRAFRVNYDRPGFLLDVTRWPMPALLEVVHEHPELQRGRLDARTLKRLRSMEKARKRKGLPGYHRVQKPDDAGVLRTHWMKDPEVERHPAIGRASDIVQHVRSLGPAISVFADRHGTEWHVKISSHIEAGASRLHRLFGLSGPDVRTLYVPEGHLIRRTLGRYANRVVVQRMLPGEVIGDKTIRDLNPAQQATVLREHLFDLMIGNGDGHSQNFLLTPDGRAIGIDKGLAFSGFSGVEVDAPHDAALDSLRNLSTFVGREANRGFFADIPDADWEHVKQSVRQWARAASGIPDEDVANIVEASAARERDHYYQGRELKRHILARKRALPRMADAILNVLDLKRIQEQVRREDDAPEGADDMRNLVHQWRIADPAVKPHLASAMQRLGLTLGPDGWTAEHEGRRIRFGKARRNERNKLPGDVQKTFVRRGKVHTYWGAPRRASRRQPHPDGLDLSGATVRYGYRESRESERKLAEFALGEGASFRQLCSLAAAWTGLAQEQVGAGCAASFNVGGWGELVVTMRTPDGWTMSRRYFMANRHGEGRYAKHDSCHFERRGQGAGTALFGRAVAALRKAGFQYIETQASGYGPEHESKHFERGRLHNPNTNGYYSWARLGYDADVGPPHYAKNPYGKHVSQIMRTEEGREWWKAHGGGFTGRFDLDPKSTSSRVLAAYLAEKGMDDLAKATRDAPALEPSVEHPPDLTPEDDAILDRIWDEIGRERGLKKRKARRAD